MVRAEFQLAQQFSEFDPTLDVKYANKLAKVSNRSSILSQMYIDGEIFLRPHESVVSATSSEATAKIYKFYSVACYIANWNEFSDELARVSSQLSDEDQAKDPVYCTQLILQDDQFKVIWAICSIKMMRCKFCKLYYKYQISSGRAHIAQHFNWFKRFGSEQDKKLLCSIADGKICKMEDLLDSGEREERLLVLAQESLSYFHPFDEDDVMQQLYQKFNQLPLSLPTQDHNVLNCCHDMIVRFSTVLGLTATRIQSNALCDFISVKYTKIYYIKFHFFLRYITLYIY